MIVLPGFPHEQDRAQRRFLGLWQRSTTSTFPTEIERSARMAHAIARDFRIGVHCIPAFVPSHDWMTIARDQLSVIVDGRPWWRAHLALGIVENVGSMLDERWSIGSRNAPWEFMGKDFFMVVVGRRDLLEAIQRLYAAATFSLLSAMPATMPPGDQREAFLLAGTLYFHADLGRFVTSQRLRPRAMDLAVYVPPAPPPEPVKSTAAPATSAIETARDRLMGAAPDAWRRGQAAGTGLAYQIETRIRRAPPGFLSWLFQGD